MKKKGSETVDQLSKCGGHGEKFSVVFIFLLVLTPISGAAQDMRARIDAKRRLAYHERLLREAAESGPRIEVAWNIEEVRRSLRFIAEQGAAAGAKTSVVVSNIFEQTEDEETRRLCLNALYRINHAKAKSQLLHISRDPQADGRWRALSTEFLRKAAREGQRFAPKDARAVTAAGGQ